MVQAVIREFEKYPPQLYVETAPTYGVDTYSNQPTTPSFSESSVMTPSAYLATLSIEELKKMDEESDYLNDFVEELEVIQSLNTHLDNLINEVEIITGWCVTYMFYFSFYQILNIVIDDNMGNQQQISELNDSITTSKNVIRQLGAKYEVSNKHYQQKANEFMPSHIKVRH